MRLRVGIAVGVVVLVVGWASLPFSSQVVGGKGGGSSSLSCRPPIVIGWAGGAPVRDVPGGTEYDSSQQCGKDARERLVLAGVILLVVAGAVAITLWRRAHDRYPLPTSW